LEKAHVITASGYRTDVSAREHTWHSDLSIEADGTDTGPNPEEMILGALGSCTVQTLHMYASRKKWDLQRVEVDLEFVKLRAEEVPDYEGKAKFVYKIHKAIRLYGDLDEKQRERLMEISTRCPVHRVLEGPTFLTQSDQDNLPEDD
jgi:uncharacterized OsmC-like protein